MCTRNGWYFVGALTGAVACATLSAFFTYAFVVWALDPSNDDHLETNVGWSGVFVVPATLLAFCVLVWATIATGMSCMRCGSPPTQ